MNKKQNRGGAAEWFSRILDLPADLCGDRLTAELRGRRHLLVCGVRSILEYGPERIRLGLQDGEIRIEGSGLQMTAYYHRQTGIDGDIRTISLHPGEERKC